MGARGKIRVLHLIASNFVGGPEKQILRHATQDSSGQVEIWIGSFRDTPEKTEILCRAEALGIATLEFGSGRFLPQAVNEVLSAEKQHDISILCTHGYKANVIGYLASNFTNRPHVAFVRGWTAETLRVRFYDWLERMVLRRASRVVCVSGEQAREVARTRGKRNPALVISNAVEVPAEASGVNKLDRRRLRQELGLLPDAFIIGAAGRLSPEKGHCFLLDAASLLLTHIPALQVVVLGEGQERAQLQQQALSLGMKSHVLLPGFRTDVQRWMQACDVIVNPSATEGMPNIVLEAMALGLPVVATAVGAVPDMIVHGESGLLVPAGDPLALALKLKEEIWQIFSNPSWAQTLGQKGQESVRRFSPECQRQQLLELYAQTLEQQRKICLSLAPKEQGSQKDPQLETRQYADRDFLPRAESREPTACLQPTADGQQPPPFISIVIPVRNEQEYLAGVLDDLTGQDYPKDRFEILVVDGGSTDHTPDLVRRYSSNSPVAVRLLPNLKAWSSAGRNQGVLHSRGEIIVFVDGHCHIENPYLLRDAARLLNSTGADCLCRPQPLDDFGAGTTAATVAAARGSFFGHAIDSAIYDLDQERFLNPTSSGAIYRRSVFERVGYYDERFDACEDLDFNYRVHCAGLVAYSSPLLAITYQARSSYGALWQQMTRYGRGRFRFIRKHRKAITFPQLVLPGFALALASCLAAGLLFPPCLYAAAALTGTYAAVSLAISAGLAWHKRSLQYLAAPMAFATIHFGLVNGFIREAASALFERWEPGPGLPQAPVRSIPHAVTDSHPLISVVIPVRNEEAHLAAVFDDLISQEYPKDRIEIVVVDGGSTDHTLDVVRQYSSTSPVMVRLFTNPKGWSSAGRNVGVQHSRGDVLVFVDGHCHIENPRLLNDTVWLLNSAGADCLCRPGPLDDFGGGPTAEIIAAARASFFGHATDSAIYDLNRERYLNPTSSGAIYRRSVFERIGYFDEHFDACEDVDFNYRVHRAGLLSYSSPRLSISYQARGTYRALWQQMTRYGRGRFRFIRKHRNAITIPQLALPGFALALIACLIAAMRVPVCLYAAAILAGAYAAVSLATSVGLAWQKRSLRFLAAPVAFATIHFGLANGFLREAAASLWGHWQPPVPRERRDVPPAEFTRRSEL